MGDSTVAQLFAEGEERFILSRHVRPVSLVEPRDTAVPPVGEKADDQARHGEPVLVNSEEQDADEGHEPTEERDSVCTRESERLSNPGRDVHGRLPLCARTMYHEQP